MTGVDAIAVRGWAEAAGFCASGGEGVEGVMAWAAGVGGGESIVVPLPSSAMMGIVLIGGFLLFGRMRPRRDRRRRSRS